MERNIPAGMGYTMYMMCKILFQDVVVISNPMPLKLRFADFATSIFACKMIGKEFLLKKCVPKW